MILTGKMSTFGGPDDKGVKPDEGLALIEPMDLAEWWFARLFLAKQPPKTTGLARRLNPNAFYLAMRFDYGDHSRELVRRAIFRVTNPRTHKSLFAQGADWGPNARTNRVVDMSPGLATALALNDTVTVEMIV